MLVWLFAALFQALGIHVIQRVISKPSFIFITTWIMAGVGVALAKEHAQIISTLRAISSTLCRSLTPPIHRVSPAVGHKMGVLHSAEPIVVNSAIRECGVSGWGGHSTLWTVSAKRR
jgi:hypothetical protein